MATTVEGAIVARLLEDDDIADLIGTAISPFTELKDDAQSRARLTYWRIDTQRSSSIGALTNDGPTGMALARIQFDAWATDMLTAKLVINAVRRSLNGFAGVLSGITIGQIHTVNERDNSTTIAPGTKKPVQRTTMDFMVTYTET